GAVEGGQVVGAGAVEGDGGERGDGVRSGGVGHAATVGARCDSLVFRQPGSPVVRSSGRPVVRSSGRPTVRQRGSPVGCFVVPAIRRGGPERSSPGVPRPPSATHRAPAPRRCSYTGSVTSTEAFEAGPDRSLERTPPQDLPAER